MWRCEQLTISTRGRAFHDLSDSIQRLVQGAGLTVGLCHLFLRHTSASLCVTENADPVVRDDLERFAQRLVPDGDPLFRHDSEGPDDMPAHVRNIIVGCQLTLPIRAGRLALGTWQGIYLWEHREARQHREILVTLNGDG